MHPACENCGLPAHYVMTMTHVTGEEFVSHMCAECALTMATWVFPNNDEAFAGPDQVVETLTYRLLDGDRYRHMVTAERARLN